MNTDGPRGARAAGRARLAELARRHARYPEQTVGLRPGWRTFFASEHRGAICYRLCFGTALCASEPICAATDRAAVLDEFLHACRQRRLHAVWLPVSEGFARAKTTQGCAAWKVGETPIIRAGGWPPAGAAGAPLRAALHAARRTGVQVRPVSGFEDDRALLEALQHVHRGWLNARPLPQLGFVLDDDPLAPSPGRRWFVAEQEGGPRAFATVFRLRNGRVLAIEHLIRLPNAPRGSVEALVAAVVQSAADPATEVVLPLVPLRGLSHGALGGPLVLGAGDRSHWAAIFVMLALRRNGWIYGAAGLERFRAKLQPARWEAMYLVHSPSRMLPRMAVAAAIELMQGRPAPWVAAAVQAAAAALGAGPKER